MKKIIIISLFLLPLTSKAQVIEIIKAIITAAIKAADLKIQQLQNETIWLQNAEKSAENTLSENKLAEISGWMQKQKELYAKYYKELSEVKTAISDDSRIQDAIAKQGQITKECSRFTVLLRQDGHFNASEIQYMGQVTTGIINESVKSLNQLQSLLNPGTSSMKDSERMALLQTAIKGINENYDDLKAFEEQTSRLSLQRAKDGNDVNSIKKLYGLP